MKYITFLSIIAYRFISIPLAYAAETGIFGEGLLKAGEKTNSSDPTIDILKGDTVQGFIGGIVPFLINTAIAISTLMIVVGGVQYIYGSLTGQETGKKTITYAIIGLIVSLLAFTITTAFKNFFGA